MSREGGVIFFSGYFVQAGTVAIGDGDSGCGIAGTVAIGDGDSGCGIAGTVAIGDPGKRRSI